MEKKLFIIIAALAGLIVGYLLHSVPTPRLFGSGTQTQTVGGNLVVLGSVTASAATTTSAGLSVSGTAMIQNLTVTGTEVVAALSNSFGEVGMFAATSSMSATSTPCDFTNPTGRTITLLSVTELSAPTPSVGPIQWTIGTSTDGWTTSTSPLVSTTITTSNSRSTMNTTSSLQSLYAFVLPTEHVTFKASTSSNSGVCRYLYY